MKTINGNIIVHFHELHTHRRQLKSKITVDFHGLRNLQEVPHVAPQHLQLPGGEGEVRHSRILHSQNNQVGDGKMAAYWQSVDLISTLIAYGL